MQFLRKLNSGVARGEAWTATAVLLLMILVASIQAVLRNLTDFQFGWANDALAELEWIDPFLKKGTVWVAFLGASLATYHEKHIAIDIFPRLAPETPKRVMKSLVGIGSGATAIGLAIVFWGAVINNAADRPLEYEVLVDGEASHICEADPSLLAEYGMERPSVYCVVRTLMNATGATAETPEGASQFIMPIMFMIIGVRLFGQGVWAGGQLFIPAWAAKEEDEDSGSDEDTTDVDELDLASDADADADEGDLGPEVDSDADPEADSDEGDLGSEVDPEAGPEADTDEPADSDADDVDPEPEGES